MAAPPETYRDGFSLKTVLGALFITLFMLPGGMYLGLVAGMGVGEAAEWVTIVLFAEVARRSYKPLSKQEIYVLYYIAAALTSAVSLERGLAGGPFSNLIWSAYFLQSAPAAPFAADVPTWAAPALGSEALVQRELWNSAWMMPILLLVVLEICNRLCWMGLGFVLFRVTSDVEKLPFPYAPVAASGATALAEAGSETWRWRVFSSGAVIGLLFGFVYVGLPIFTNTAFGSAVQIFPIPFADYTPAIENVLPGAVVGISFSLGAAMFGMILPFEIVLGSTVASVLSMIVVNPILVRAGMMPHYQPGSNGFLVKLTSDLDFWLSVGIGLNLAVAILGMVFVVRAFRAFRKRGGLSDFQPPPGRGDWPIWISIAAYIAATSTLIFVAHRLVPGFPLWILVFFGFIWTPLNSYVSARMIGLTGRGVGFPYLKEASVVASGYKNVDVWFAPMPVNDYGWAAQRFREVQLTGTKFTSILKAELLMLPLILIASFLFWAFFWNANPLPSGQFPYANRFWPFHSQMQAVMMQVNAEEGGWFRAAIKPDLIAGSTAGGLLLFGILSIFKVPALFFYGFVGGIAAYPAITVPQLIGAWFGRKMSRKYGVERWRDYAPVVFAGFACGSGLIAMFAISTALVAKAVQKLPY